MKKKPYFHKITSLVTGISFALLPIEYAKAINTQIQTDSTLSGINAINIDSQGGNQIYTLSEINGKTVGNNLFYSFSNFSIGATDTAWFNLNSPDLANVISRVTGGVESIIDGQLQMTNVGSAPSFFFINPTGITFSAGASVDVPGSFYVSTASGLNISDGSIYAAHETQTSTLSAAEPESFGFLGNEAGSINISGLETDLVELALQPGTDVAFVGNDIYIENALIMDKDAAPAGLDLQFIATGNKSARISLDTLPNEATAGNLSLKNATLATLSHGPGRIVVRSNHFNAINSNLFLSNSNSDAVPIADGRGIDIQAHTLTLDNSKLSATSNENAADITISADLLEISNLSQINSTAVNHSGAVTITADDLSVDQSSILSTISGEGSTGNVTVSADSVKLLNGGIIRSGTGTGTGTTSAVFNVDSGSVTINAQELLISDSTIDSLILEGNAGDITINVDYLSINNSTDFDRGIFSRVLEGGGEGNSGDVIVNSKAIEMNRGFISSRTFGSTGQAGDISVTTDILKISGGVIVANTSTADRGGSISINAAQLSIDSRGTIQSVTFGDGNGGNIAINAEEIEIGGVASGIFANTLETGTGNAGNITVNAESILLKDSGSIQSAVNDDAQGNGGIVTVSAKTLVLNDGFMSARTFTSGNAGNIIISADVLRLNDSGRILAGSGNRANRSATGDGGSISIDAEVVELSNAFIVNETYGSGNSGQVSINADSVQLHENSFISASTFGSGRSGDIHITANAISVQGTGKTDVDLSSDELTGVFSGAAPGSSGQIGNITLDARNGRPLDIQLENGAHLSIQNAAIVADNAIDSTTPSVITIDAANLSLINSFITAQSSGNVDAGDINIHFTDQLFLDPSVISTEANDGHGGTITISGGELIYLLDSAITTSVKGQEGDGGNINISADSLIMDSGFIQANTAATNASGGNVNINVSTLIPSGSFLQTGGDTLFDFQPFSGINVIQAAAPDGVSGTITAATPQLNLSGVLTNLIIESIDSNTLNHNMCAIEQSSSLYQSGKGGMRMRARDFLLLPFY
ncbi:MAG: filamentous hemagglutinin N-terminal domain-containing protein [Nitrosomonas sp.]|nr:filamentous hemagglutinin N-terminal domain-containing protein [Nitrosomonas sp.]